MMRTLKRFYFFLFLLLCTSFVGMSCSSNSNCPLPYPFCGGTFPLNTQQTTPYGPAWADVTTSTEDWITCFGPYALCFYANCTVTDSSDPVANCPCYSTFGTNFVDINAILNDDIYNATKIFCAADPAACKIPNQAPVCQSLNSGEFMTGANLFSTFSFYRATQEPIGMTDCAEQPGLYAGCMTAPCFNPTSPGVDDTTMIQCSCPTYDGPFQIGQDNMSCENSANMVYSAAYNPTPPPSGDPCDMINGCVPDAPPENCGCGLYVPDVTTIPADSDIDCALVCQQYDTCERGSIELGYTCDATLCTSETTSLIADACDGLQNCDLSEIFKAESAAQCSCCASQLCGCTPNDITNQKIGTLNTQQNAAGDTTQCEINGTLCGS